MVGAARRGAAIRELAFSRTPNRYRPEETLMQPEEGMVKYSRKNNEMFEGRKEKEEIGSGVN